MPNNKLVKKTVDPIVGTFHEGAIEEEKTGVDEMMGEDEENAEEDVFDDEIANEEVMGDEGNDQAKPKQKQPIGY